MNIVCDGFNWLVSFSFSLKSSFWFIYNLFISLFFSYEFTPIGVLSSMMFKHCQTCDWLLWWKMKPFYSDIIGRSSFSWDLLFCWSINPPYFIGRDFLFNLPNFFSSWHSRIWLSSANRCCFAIFFFLRLDSSSLRLYQVKWLLLHLDFLA